MTEEEGDGQMIQNKCSNAELSAAVVDPLQTDHSVLADERRIAIRIQPLIGHCRWRFFYEKN